MVPKADVVASKAMVVLMVESTMMAQQVLMKSTMMSLVVMMVMRHGLKSMLISESQISDLLYSPLSSSFSHPIFRKWFF